MPALIYIHGFLSSPLSHKAQQVGEWLGESRPNIVYHCPMLSAYPGEVQNSLEQLVESLLPEPVYLMGSSMGGFWATYLAEKYDLPAVLINPAVKPTSLMPKYVGLPLKNYHTEDTYTLGSRDIETLAKLEVHAPQRLNNYWLLSQTGDETLNYKLGVDYYQGCRQTIEEGGDHGFERFERFIPAALEFCETYYQELPIHKTQ